MRMDGGISSVFRHPPSSGSQQLKTQKPFPPSMNRTCSTCSHWKHRTDAVNDFGVCKITWCSPTCQACQITGGWPVRGSWCCRKWKPAPSHAPGAYDPGHEHAAHGNAHRRGWGPSFFTPASKVAEPSRESLATAK